MSEKLNSDSVLKSLGKNIRQIRLLKGLSQQSLAESISKSTNFVSLLENGNTGLSVQTIVDLCKALDVNANAIFSGIIIATEKNLDAFILESLELFNDSDKSIVAGLITYIKNSKN